MNRASEAVETPRFPEVKPSPSPEVQRSRNPFGSAKRFGMVEHLDTPSVERYEPNVLVESKHHASPGALSFGPGFGKAIATQDRGAQSSDEDDLLRRLAGQRCELIDGLRSLLERRIARQQREMDVDVDAEEAIAARYAHLERQWETLAVSHDDLKSQLREMGVLKHGGEKETVASILRRLDPPVSDSGQPSGRVLLCTLDGVLRWAMKNRKAARVVQNQSAPAWRKGLGPNPGLEEQLRACILANPQKVEDLFATWSESTTRDDGGMTRSEFRHAVQILGLRAPVAEVNLLFASIDTNHDGTLSFAELKRAIAKRNPASIENRRRRKKKEEVVEIADYHSLQAQLKTEVVRAEDTWNALPAEERDAYRRLAAAQEVRSSGQGAGMGAG